MLPRIYSGARRAGIRRLLLNGVAQTGVAFLVAWSVRTSIGRTAAGENLGLPIAALIGGGVAMFALRVLQRTEAERIGQDYVMRVRMRLFDRISALPPHAERNERYGLTLTRMVTDLNSLRAWASQGFAQVLVASVAIPGTLAAIAWVHPSAGIAACALVLLCLGVGVLTATRLRDQVRELRRRRGRMAANLGEKVAAYLSVRHFGRTVPELRRVRSHSQRMRDAAVRRARTMEMVRAAPDAALPVATAILLLGSQGSGVLLGRAELVTAVVLLGLLSRSVRDVARGWSQRLNYEEGYRRISQVLESERIREPGAPSELPPAEATPLIVDDVGLEGVFAGAYLYAPPGSQIAVTGPSGAGKSALLGLIARLADPSQGELSLGDVALPSLSSEDRHSAIQLVSPSLPLIRGTVAQNVEYAAAVQPDAAVVAARICRLHEPSCGLPDGLETHVEEQGRNLANGVRARVALARALATQPRVLLIDDLVFSADDEARSALLAAIEHFDFTLVWTVRRDEDLVAFDQIWQVAAGKVVAKNLEPR